jgi:hypothetical protein
MTQMAGADVWSNSGITLMIVTRALYQNCHNQQGRLLVHEQGSLVTAGRYASVIIIRSEMTPT